MQNKQNEKTVCTWKLISDLDLLVTTCQVCEYPVSLKFKILLLQAKINQILRKAKKMKNKMNSFNSLELCNFHQRK